MGECYTCGLVYVRASCNAGCRGACLYADRGIAFAVDCAIARALQIFAQNSFGVFVFGFKKYGISFEHVPTVGEPTNVFHIFPIFYGQVYFQSIIRRVDFPLRIFIGSMNLN